MIQEFLPSVAGAFFAATATGFLGSLHCIGMCGTAAASIISRQSPPARPLVSTPIQIMPFSADLVGVKYADGVSGVNSLSATNTKLFNAVSARLSGEKNYHRIVGAAARNSLLFNAGRITSYIVAGMLVAGMASALAGQVIMRDLMPLRLALFVIGQLLVVATGFYIAGYTKLLAPFERVGHALWRLLQRWIAQLLKPDRRRHKIDLFLLGALWGWIPCGMVYAMLATAMASGTAQNGALVMFGFGLGTLPAMFAAGTAAIALRRLAQKQNVRLAAGAVVIALGLYGLSRIGSLSDFAALGSMCASKIEAAFSSAAR